jgi:hypothetical protein
MININENDNYELYYENLDACLEYCKKIDENVNIKEKTNFHVFWNVGLPFSRKQTLNLKSYLCTQDIENTTYNLWSNVDLSDNEYLKPFLPFIKIRVYDPTFETKGTILENRTDIITAQDEKNWAKGDLFRLLILHKYGGVYTDVDVVFLRNFAPLINQEFMYKWGREKSMINGAVMRLFKQSKLSYQLLNEISSGPVVPNSTIWSTNLYEKVRKYNTNWTIFPSGFFNSEWQDVNLNTWNPMKKYDYSKYNGSFSWHWHNKWNDEVEEGSKWFDLEKYYDDLLIKKYTKINFKNDHNS